MIDLPAWDALLRANAAAYARVALANIEREFPSDIWHVAHAPDDLPRRPRERTPVFWGSFDWHSCVEMHWLLVRLLRLVPEAIPAARGSGPPGPPAAAGTARAPRPPSSRTPTTGTDSVPTAGAGRSRSSTSWSAGTIRTRGAGRRARRRSRPPSPATSSTGCPGPRTPSATGSTANSAFGLGLALPFATSLAGAGEPALLETRSWRPPAAGTPGTSTTRARWEPSGFDFLSPALVEAELMSRILDARPRSGPGSAGFLPGIDGRGRRRSSRRRSCPTRRRAHRAPARAEPEPGMVLAADRRVCCRRTTRGAGRPSTPPAFTRRPACRSSSATTTWSSTGLPPTRCSC